MAEQQASHLRKETPKANPASFETSLASFFAAILSSSTSELTKATVSTSVFIAR
jgi:hypothetical protein